MSSNTCSSAIEFERKFAFTVDTEAILLQKDAKLMKEELLEDVYYDTEDYVLALHDHWLRRRNARWELKYRLLGSKEANINIDDDDDDDDDEGAAVLQYREESDESRICELVSSILVLNGQRGLTRSELTDAAVHVAGLDCGQFKVLAVLKSRRKKYSIDNLVVDLDETDFGFRVGEIELLAEEDHHDHDHDHCHEEVSSVARRRINSLAETLGISKQRVSGKMENYLATKNPKLYQKLVDNNILSAI